MLFAITVCALAIVALLADAVVLHISLARSSLATQLSLGKLQLVVDKQTTTALRSELDALAAGLDAQSRRTRKEFGSVWNRFHELAQQDLLEEDDIAGALEQSTDPRAQLVGKAHNQLGVGRAAPTPAGVTCQCGYCQICVDRAMGAANGAA